MTTIAKLDANDSDSENDLDYIPNIEDEQSSSEEDDDRNAKRAKTEYSVQLTEEQKAKDEQERASLWADFQASVQSSAKSSGSTPSIIPEKLVKIQKRYRFAGEDVNEIVEVLENSEDAKKWPLWIESEKLVTSSSEALNEGIASTSRDQNSSNTSSSSPQPDAMSSTIKPSAAPRKPKAKASLFSNLPNSKAAKAKQLTTLQKSAMDWRTHVSTEEQAGSSLKDELEANRRGGGYLEKIEFLDRVEQRREDLLDAGKSSKRRRG